MDRLYWGCVLLTVGFYVAGFLHGRMTKSKAAFPSLKIEIPGAGPNKESGQRLLPLSSPRADDVLLILQDDNELADLIRDLQAWHSYRLELNGANSLSQTQRAWFYHWASRPVQEAWALIDEVLHMDEDEFTMGSDWHARVKRFRNLYNVRAERAPEQRTN